MQLVKFIILKKTKSYTEMSIILIFRKKIRQGWGWGWGLGWGWGCGWGWAQPQPQPLIIDGNIKIWFFINFWYDPNANPELQF